MPWQRSSTVDHLPDDPVGEVVAASLVEILQGADVELVYSPADAPLPPTPVGPATASATGDGPRGWQVTCTLRLDGRFAALVEPDGARLSEIMEALPSAALRAAAQFRPTSDATAAPLTPPMQRALRDTIVIEMLGHQQGGSDAQAATELIAGTIEYLIELSGTRVESHDLTHGVIIADVLRDTPRLQFDYPADLRAAKRAPLLFDGQRSVLLVDRAGHARAELQRHRLDRLLPITTPRAPVPEFIESGSLVAEASRRLGGVGFFLRADRTIWTFVGGQPLLLRRGEHWTAFPLELAAFIGDLIGGGPAASIVVQAAFIISAQGRGAILAIVPDADSLDDIVSPKDRYDLRDDFDPPGMRTETRLHHLIDAEALDEQTLARLGALDGATMVDRKTNLLAYGAIVTSSDSQHEGARTAAAKSLSHTADVVLKVSEDGDITVFHAGEVLVTLLGSAPEG